MKRFRFLLLLLLILSILLATLCGCPKIEGSAAGEQIATGSASTETDEATDSESNPNESGDASGDIPADPGYTKRY